MTENRDLVLITEFFHPDTVGTGQRMTDLAVGLHDRGFDVTVYTAQPHQHSSGIERWQPRKMTYRGVEVRRSPFPSVRQSSLPRRGFNWLLFLAWISMVLLLRQRNREVLFVSHPPLLPPVVWLVARVTGRTYSYVVHDLYPDAAVELGYISRGGVIERIWSRLNRSIFGDARYVIALGPAMQARIRDQSDTATEPDVVVIPNWEDDDLVEPLPKQENWFSRKHGLLDEFVVLYSGSIAVYHDLETLLRAAAMMDSDVRFLLIGEGENKQSIVDLADELGVLEETVRFLPFQPWETLPYSLTCADITVVTVKEGFEGVNVSGKTFTALAAGQPVLVIAQPNDDESRLVEKFDAGFHVPQGDVDGVIEAIETWQSNPDLVTEHGENARRAFERRFTKEKCLDAYYRLLAFDELPE